MLKAISIILLAALLVGCTNTEATPAEPTPGVSPGPVTPPVATATATPAPTAVPTPEPTATPTSIEVTSLGRDEGGNPLISFETSYPYCSDNTDLLWICNVEDGTATCLPMGDLSLLMFVDGEELPLNVVCSGPSGSEILTATVEVGA